MPTLLASGIVNSDPCQAVEFQVVVLWGNARHILHAPSLPAAPEKEAELELHMVADKHRHFCAVVGHDLVSRPPRLSCAHLKRLTFELKASVNNALLGGIVFALAE